MLAPTFAAKEIESILRECLERQGWAMPEPVVKRTVDILVNKIDKNPWQPEPSYAEVYLTIKSPQALLTLGDTCFFTRAVFPELGSNRGINSNYYVQLGQSCYDRVLKHTIPNPTLEQLRDHFEFLAEIVYTAIWSKGDFRSMWE